MTALLDDLTLWTIRTDDARVAFSGRASRFTPKVQARFTDVRGSLSEHAVDVDVHVRSLTTGNPAYDEVLAVVDPFDVDRHPVARYRSGRVRWAGGHAVVDGELELRGRSAPVRLTASYEDLACGARRLSARGRVDRRVFGLRLQVPGCGAFVPDHLDLSVDVVADRLR